MKNKVTSSKSPEAIGPYSQAVIAGNFIFCSGQIALDPVLGEIIGKDIEEQTKQVLSNLKAVLKEANCDFANVVKTTIYLKNTV